VINAATARKLAEIKRLVSRSTPIILVKKNIFSAFSRPLRDAGYNVIHKSFLPFPSHGHQARFVRACRNCLRRAQEKKGKRGSGAYTGGKGGQEHILGRLRCLDRMLSRIARASLRGVEWRFRWNRPATHRPHQPLDDTISILSNMPSLCFCPLYAYLRRGSWRRARRPAPARR
jgi:hypothetical protein